LLVTFVWVALGSNILGGFVLDNITFARSYLQLTVLLFSLHHVNIKAIVKLLAQFFSILCNSK